jgi:hypothetical protein
MGGNEDSKYVKGGGTRGKMGIKRAEMLQTKKPESDRP